MSTLSGPLSWPSFYDISADMKTKDYNHLFANKENISECPKALCANGVICKVRIEWFAGHEYTGLFENADYGLMRLSSALASLEGNVPIFAGSITRSKLFPCVAIKIFR